MAKDVCPKCDGLKDTRANMCSPCRFIHNHPRLGTGKGWYVCNSTGGYIVATINGKFKLQHRVIMEEYLERGLEQGECVHHLDSNRTNNSIDNLELMLTKEHHKLHLTPERAKAISVKGHKARWGYKHESVVCV